MNCANFNARAVTLEEREEVRVAAVAVAVVLVAFDRALATPGEAEPPRTLTQRVRMRPAPRSAEGPAWSQIGACHPRRCRHRRSQHGHSCDPGVTAYGLSRVR